MKWLVETLGPVILGAKPAEIISYPKFDCMRCEKIQAIDMGFEKAIKIKYLKIPQENGQMKIIFYDPVHLSDVLMDKRNRNFLVSIGYPTNGTMDAYLKILSGKIKSGICPDEIGVFLGYPLKDVIGYMGHPSLKLTKVQYWRVYGDERVSDEKYKQIQLKKDEMRCMMNENSLSCVLKAI
jgi:hypothetical protein